MMKYLPLTLGNLNVLSYLCIAELTWYTIISENCVCIFVLTVMMCVVRTVFLWNVCDIVCSYQRMNNPLKNCNAKPELMWELADEIEIQLYKAIGI